MKIDKPSPFDSGVATGLKAFDLRKILPIVFVISLELAMFVMFYAIYTETVSLMSEAYLSELPVIGGLFRLLDPDANASHIVSMLLAVFSVATPLFIWSEIHRQNILDNPQEWFSHPQNQVIASIAALVVLMVIGLEVVNLYTLVARETMAAQGGFVMQTQTGVMTYLAQNKALAIGVSLVIAVINIVLAFFTTRTVISMKSGEV